MKDTIKYINLVYEKEDDICGILNIEKIEELYDFIEEIKPELESNYKSILSFLEEK